MKRFNWPSRSSLTTGTFNRKGTHNLPLTTVITQLTTGTSQPLFHLPRVPLSLSLSLSLSLCFPLPRTLFDVFYNRYRAGFSSLCWHPLSLSHSLGCCESSFIPGTMGSKTHGNTIGQMFLPQFCVILKTNTFFVTWHVECE